MGFPGGSVIKNLSTDAEDAGEVVFVLFCFTTALSFIRDFIKAKFLQLKESVREHKAHEASSDLIVNHWLRFFVGITASFQIQIIVRILLWPHRRGQSPLPKT